VSPGQSLDLGDLAPLPPPALEEAFDDLAALDLCRHFGELLGQALDLRRQAGPDCDPRPDHGRQQHQVHDRDRQ
jgi:hypothetical protein